MKILITNKYTHIPTIHDFYIGRGSPLGNPFTHIKDRKTKAKMIVDSVEESIEYFHYYMIDEISNRNYEIINELEKIRKASETNDIYLVCFCFPKKCHGEIIKTYIEKLIKKNKRADEEWYMPIEGNGYRKSTIIGMIKTKEISKINKQEFDRLKNEL